MKVLSLQSGLTDLNEGTSWIKRQIQEVKWGLHQFGQNGRGVCGAGLVTLSSGDCVT